MKNLILKKIAPVLNAFTVSLLLFVSCAGIATVQYSAFAVCDYAAGKNMFNDPANCLPPGVPDKLIPDVIDDAVSWLLGFAVAISVVALVYGGTYYVFSSGDTQKTENAKKIVKYALIGIFIAGVSFAIITILDTIFG